MVYGIFGVFDQNRWFRNNFSDEDLLTGTIFTDVNEVTAKNLTGFTVKIILSRPDGPGRHGDFLQGAATIVSAANGTWSFAMREEDVPPRGLYYIAAEISKTGTRETTINRVEFFILEGPAG